MKENISYILIYDTAKEICEKYGKDITKMEEWEIGELVDRFIDESLYPQYTNIEADFVEIFK